jgi:hypothetical protein
MQPEGTPRGPNSVNEKIAAGAPSTLMIETLAPAVPGHGGTGMRGDAAQRSDRAAIPSDPFTLLARARRAQRGIAAGG